VDPPAVLVPSLELNVHEQELNGEDDEEEAAVSEDLTVGEEILTVLTAADVEFDMDKVMQEVEFMDDESEPSGDEMD
jgi:hypothetical protein